MMRYLSVCSGIEAATVAWHPLGWEAAAFAEIEPFPRAVLAHHYPDVPLHGDFTSIEGDEYGAINLLVGGTPCQSFSVAGKRLGLDDPRGNLAIEFLRLARRCRARWVVWENVPGVMSDRGGAFGAFLQLLGECGYGFAYRVLDAQYFGVPQRRRRVFVVGYLGDWRPAAAVLFERESLQGDITPRREAREGVAGTLGARTGISRGAQDASCGHIVPDVVGSLDTECGGNKMTHQTLMNHHVLPVPPVAWALKERDSKGSDSSTKDGHLIPMSYGIPGNWIGRKPENGGNAVEPMHDLCPNLTGTDKHAVSYALPINTQIAMRHEAMGEGTGLGIGGDGDPAFTLQSAHSHAVAVAQNQRGEVREMDVAPALNAGGGKPGEGYQAIAFTERGRSQGRTFEAQEELAYCLTNPGSGGRTHSRQLMDCTMRVRRLTPRECERLQGFPEIKNHVTIQVWSTESQKNDAVAEISSRKLPKYVLSAEESVSIPHVNRAAVFSNANNPECEKPVALNVRLDLERMAVEISSAGKLLLSANNAERAEKSPLPIPAADFVRLLALMPQILVPLTKGGKAELPANIRHSTLGLNGSALVNVSGQEINAHAKDAEQFIMDMESSTKSTTSEVGQNSLNCAAAWTTWCCSVVSAISGFIPETTQKSSSYAISVEATTPYTLVPYRGKPAADGPRYKALGNSMAVPVMRWIGERIAIMEAHHA